MSARALAVLSALALAAGLGALSAAPPAPTPDEAPHGIANQAADAPPAAAQDDRLVAVPEPTEKALRYARGGNWLWALGQVWTVLVPGVILFTGFSAWLRDRAQRIGRNWYFTIAVYFAMFLAVTFIVDLPLSYFAGFVRPHAYGLSNQTFSKWAGDELKELFVLGIAGVGLLWIPYLLFRKSPRRWWLWMSVIAIPLAAFFMLIAPVAIDPLFNKFGPMKDKALEQRILNLAGRAGIDGARVFEVEKIVDTNTVNAYVTGFGGTKRIVLWDTAIAKLAPDELLFVMGHEMGHFVLRHVVKSIFFFAATLLLTLYAAYRLQGGLIARFGSRWGFAELSDVASLPLAIVMFVLLGLIITPVDLAYSRWQEHEADRFGLEITKDNHAAATAFVKLQQENLGVPRRGPLYKLWRADHPLLGERIDFCNAYRPWEQGRPGRYEHLFH